MRTTAIAAALAAACLAAAPALASEARLDLRGIDLSTDAGKTELDRRIDVAARQVCTPDTVTGTIIKRAPSRTCIAEARGKLASMAAARVDRMGKTQPGAASAAR